MLMRQLDALAFVPVIHIKEMVFCLPSSGSVLGIFIDSQDVCAGLCRGHLYFSVTWVY